MKILVCIAQYGLNQLDHLKTLLYEYSLYSHSVDIVIDYTQNIPEEVFPKNLKITLHQHPTAIGHGLTFCHRAHMVEQKDNYDIFIYTENDILITEKNVESWLGIQSRLPKYAITGFLRYEQFPNSDIKYLMDAHPEFPMILSKSVIVDGERYFRLVNLHSGCWILTKEMLHFAIYTGNFLVAPHITSRESTIYMVLESGATDVYSQCWFEHKIFPYNGFESLMVPHLANKYLFLMDNQENPISTSPEKLRALLDL